MNVAIIPARGGSRRIARKNIRPFRGRPIIGWSIEAALESGCFDRVIVSTDEEEIAEVAIQFGAQVPFMRPPELSDDRTGTVPVIGHAIEWLESGGEHVDLACCIYATAPFLQPGDLREGQNALLASDCDYAFSVTSYAFPIQRALRLGDDGGVEMFWPEHCTTRSQDLEAAYHDAGQFYWGRPGAWKAGRAIFGLRSRPVMIPRHRVQDIDTLEDWTRAEWMFAAMREEAAQ